MFIYKITCKATNKVYIGQTINAIDQRFKRHLRDATFLDTHFARAIRLYGKDNFYVEQIDTATSQEELTKKEVYWINYYQATDPLLGYNETANPFKCGGDTYSNKSGKELLAIKEKISKANTGSRNGQAKQVKCKNINTGEILFFETVTACAKHFKIKNRSLIKNHCDRSDKILYKEKYLLCWANDKFPEDFTTFDPSSRRGKKVTLIKDAEALEFPSLHKAAVFLNVPQSAIIAGSIINQYQVKL